MNNIFKTALVVALVAFAPVEVFAGPGHDHGDSAPTSNTVKLSPRFEAHSDLFEVVGVLAKGELSITVDRYKNNEPVLNAKVELESGSTKLTGKFHADHGDYRLASKPFEKPGTYPISLTITAGDEIDILAGSLVVPDPEAGHDHTSDVFAWKRWAVICTLIAALLVVTIFIVRRRATRINHV